MSVLRFTQTARIAIRAPSVSSLIPVRRDRAHAQVMAGRFYSPDSRVEGATGSSTGFSKKEQAEEGSYIKRKEHEKLKQAQEKLKQAQADVVSHNFALQDQGLSSCLGFPLALSCSQPLKASLLRDARLRTYRRVGLAC